MARILIVEDQAELAEVLRENLEVEGHRAHIAPDAEGALEAMEAWRPDLVVLDLMLPDRPGGEVLRTVRGRGFTGPVLILSARSDQATKVRGFREGADDYVTKPFGLLELLARVENLLRRIPDRRLPDEVALGGLRVYPAGRRVLDEGGEELPLRPREMDLLLALLARPNEAVDRRDLLTRVWGYSPRARTRTVDWHVAELRSKIEPDPSDPRYIRTVRGVGYRLDLPE